MIPPPPASSNPDVAPDDDAATLVETLALRGRHHPPMNRRASGGASRLQLITMVASTLAAAVFCVLYINKPVIVTAPDGVIEVPVPAPADASVAPEVPVVETATPAPAIPETASSTRDGHEETNLRIQHVLNASTPEGDLSRIVIEVPVLYPSRSLRWTDAEVAQARGILARVANYHEQSRNLREHGAEILGDWNDLIEGSIPSAELRADSPSLPANQEDTSRMPRPAILDTTDAIEIRATEP